MWREGSPPSPPPFRKFDKDSKRLFPGQGGFSSYRGPSLSPPPPPPHESDFPPMSRAPPRGYSQYDRDAPIFKPHHWRREEHYRARPSMTRNFFPSRSRSPPSGFRSYYDDDRPPYGDYPDPDPRRDYYDREYDRSR